MLYREEVMNNNVWKVAATVTLVVAGIVNTSISSSMYVFGLNVLAHSLGVFSLWFLTPPKVSWGK